MKIVVTGASGLIGSALVRSLRDDGHDVRRFVRHQPAAPDELFWNPEKHIFDRGALNGVDAVVHLAGAAISRLTESRKREVMQSRVAGTTLIAEAVAMHSDTVKVLVSASAVGWYGERGEDQLDESDDRGSGFLADVVEAWETCTAAASDAGVRVANIRTGIVLSADGGVLGQTLPLFKLGLGGRLGSGKQWMPWISITDEVNAITFLLTADDVAGPVNLTAPLPVRNSDYTTAVGGALHRPAILGVPKFALRLALRDLADEGALVSQRVIPRRLLQAGYSFTHADIYAALNDIL